jgi:hypothetical protein
MAGRVLNELEKRILTNRETNLRSVVQGFGVLVEGERSKAPAEMQLDARRTAWELSGFRSQMKGEMEGVVRELCKGGYPADFDLRLERLAVAMYLLDKTGEMLDAATERKNPALTALFTSAFASIRRILDGGFFSKSPERIIDDYLDNEATIIACASCSGVQMMSLGLAVKQYKKKAADTLDSLPDVA